MSLLSGRSRSNLCLILFIALYLLVGTAFSQGCSKSNPCATGCCSKFGFCGTTVDHCGAGNCADTCDFKLGCDSSNPCKSGCCNTFGFCGLGPDYCGKKVCVAGCDSKSYCDPGGYGEFAEISKCPLNVCCSKFGFCGLTQEFCGTKKVKHRTCPKTGSLGKVIGYYEGWAVSRTCNSFYPEQIPLGVYTHLNFAFATIDPITFEVLPASSADIPLYKRLTGLKRLDPDLKVYIAIGGWTFNDPGPTASTFSDIARSKVNQAKFIKSLTSFMATYGFDGVDIDWEYPGADDRSGREEDFANLPTFMKNLKAGMKATGGRDGLTITLPASYWYLQHFDIKKLANTVDWFNMMTYDLHGTWDKGNKWLGNFLNAHTNLTEIADAMDLLWRNDINPDKVVLGTAFYGRAFTATSPSCLTPGCTFESGAKRGPCSKEISILIGSEIEDIIKQKKLTPVLDKAAAVKIITFDNDQWVAYDDAETLQLKADFARSQCMGGVMVWAVSHDTTDGKFSLALQKAAGRKVISLGQTSGDGTTTVVTSHAQCKWTNCNENCANGWTRMIRHDPTNDKGQFMEDASGCDGIGTHKLCCPPEKVPTCGWYTHNNGKCKAGCPSGMTEVGSNSMYCKSGHQTACCTTADIPAMELYNKCSWAEAPMCDNGVCSNTETAVSTTGSGGAVCNLRKYSINGGTFEVQERKYCCDASDENSQWADCKWYNNIGFGPAGRSWSEDNYCISGCPADRVRVAMDKYGGGCIGKGARSKCCLPKSQTITKREGQLDSEYRYALTDFLEEPYCDYSPFRAKRDVLAPGEGNYSIDIFPINPRSSKSTYIPVEQLLFIVLFTSPTSNQLNLWNNIVPPKYPNLTVGKIRSWIKTQFVKKSYEEAIHQVVCNLDYYNNRIGGSKTVNCFCERLDCCDADDTVCQFGEPDGVTVTKRDLLGNYIGETVEFEEVSSYWRGSQQRRDVVAILGKRAPAHAYNYVIVGGTTTSISSRPYRSTGDWPNNSPVWDLAFSGDQTGDCNQAEIEVNSLVPGPGSGFATEHVLERNAIASFLHHASFGTLPSGAFYVGGGIAVSFFITALNSPLIPQPPPMTGGEQSNNPSIRLMNALGSMENTAHFVLLIRGLNGMKSIILRHEQPVNNIRMNNLIDGNNPAVPLLKIRNVITVIRYMNHPIIQAALNGACNDFRNELFRVQEAHNAVPGNAQVDVVAYWDAWIRDDLNFASAGARDFVNARTTQMRQIWGVRTGSEANSVLQILSSLRAAASDMEIITSGLHRERLDK